MATDETAIPAWRRALPVLRGALVTVREPVAADAAALSELLTDPRVTAHINPPPPSPSSFHAFIRWAQREREEGRGVCFGIVPHSLERAVGIIQVRALGPRFETAEWGFALGAAFWSTGVFHEAATLVIDFMFRTIGAHRLEARAVSHNARGNAALQKLGALPEGVLSRSFPTNQLYEDQFLWSLNAIDWRPGHAATSRFSPEQARDAVFRAIASLDTRAWNARADVHESGEAQSFFLTGRRSARRCPTCGRTMREEKCPACQRN